MQCDDVFSSKYCVKFFDTSLCIILRLWYVLLLKSSASGKVRSLCLFRKALFHVWLLRFPLKGIFISFSSTNFSGKKLERNPFFEPSSHDRKSYPTPYRPFAFLIPNNFSWIDFNVEFRASTEYLFPSDVLWRFIIKTKWYLLGIY